MNLGGWGIAVVFCPVDDKGIIHISNPDNGGLGQY